MNNNVTVPADTFGPGDEFWVETESVQTLVNEGHTFDLRENENGLCFVSIHESTNSTQGETFSYECEHCDRVFNDEQYDTRQQAIAGLGGHSYGHKGEEPAGLETLFPEEEEA